MWCSRTLLVMFRGQFGQATRLSLELAWVYYSMLLFHVLYSEQVLRSSQCKIPSSYFFLLYSTNAIFCRTVAWACGAFFGSLLFFVLMFVTTKWPAMFIFSALYLTTSTHNLFSLLCCGSLVLPKYRGTSFSVRAGALNLGILVGTMLAGFITGTDGWRWVMFHSSNACFASGLAAAFSGSVKQEDYAGVAANSNALWKYLASRTKKNINSLKSRMVV